MAFMDPEAFNEIDTIMEFTTEDGELPTDLEAQIRGIVEESYNRNIADFSIREPIQDHEINIIWVTKAGDGWNALINTSRKDGYCVELLHDSESEETVINVYNRVRTERIADSER